MGVIARIRHKVGYVWYWRLRYWWFDTESGRQSKIVLLCMGLLACIVETVREAIHFFLPPAPHEPTKAVVWFVVYLIIMLVAAVLAIAMMPHPKGAQPVTGNSPTVTDGQQVIDAFGDVWTDDSFILAWKQMGTEPIYASGGK
jgi:hypothetical protein